MPLAGFCWAVSVWLTVMRETAQDAMDRAYRLDPTNPEVMLSFGQTLMMIGDPAQSERARLLLRSVLAY